MATFVKIYMSLQKGDHQTWDYDHQTWDYGTKSLSIMVEMCSAALATMGMPLLHGRFMRCYKWFIRTSCFDDCLPICCDLIG